MSVNRYTSIACDECGADATPEVTVRAARRAAKNEEYVHHAIHLGIDHCPECEESCAIEAAS